MGKTVFVCFFENSLEHIFSTEIKAKDWIMGVCPRSELEEHWKSDAHSFSRKNKYGDVFYYKHFEIE